MGLLACVLQELLMHLNKRVETPMHQVGYGNCRSKVAHALFYAMGNEVILLLRQIEKQLLSLDEVGHALAHYFGHQSDWAIAGIGDPLPYKVHHARVLTTEEIGRAHV